MSILQNDGMGHYSAVGGQKWTEGVKRDHNIWHFQPAQTKSPRPRRGIFSIHGSLLLQPQPLKIYLHSTSTTTPSSVFTHTCSQSLPASIQSHSLSLIGLCLCICTELVRSLRRGVVVHQPTLLATATIPAPLSFMQRLSCLPNLENVVGASLRSSGTKPPL